MPMIDATEALRVLLISEDEAIRDGVHEALSQARGEVSLYWVSQPDLATIRAKDLLPHVTLIDDALGDVNAPFLVKQVLAFAPGTVIIMLLDERAMAQASAAVLAGARGFVTKPLAPGELVANIREALGQRRFDGDVAQSCLDQIDGQSRGRVVVFCAPKGGTGRTILAINTSIALHQNTGSSLAMVDADLAAPALDVALNLHDNRDITDLLPRLSQLDQELADSILVPYTSGMRVLLAPPPGTLETSITSPQIQQMLAEFKRMYGWTVVDLGLPLNEMSFAYLDAADRIIMTVLPEMTGLRNTRLMLEELGRRGYKEGKIWLVLNRATIQGGISRRDIEQRLHVKVTHTVPDDQPLVSHSINRGVPIMLAKPKSAVGRSINALAKQIAMSLAPTIPIRPAPAVATKPTRQRWLRFERTAKA